MYRDGCGFFGFGCTIQSGRTTTIGGDLNPEWNEDFRFLVDNVEDIILDFKVYDHDPLNFDELLGEVTLPLKTILTEDAEGVPTDLDLPLDGATSGTRGLCIDDTLHIAVSYVD